MKKIFILGVIIFSINFSYGQFVPERKISPERLINFFIKDLSRKEIRSYNTSIQKYSLFGREYYLIYGEEGLEIDNKPLLVVSEDNQEGFKDLGNLYPERDYYENVNYINVFMGCTLQRVKFFHEAEFKGFIWKKFPNSDYWKPQINY